MKRWFQELVPTLALTWVSPGSFKFSKTQSCGTFCFPFKAGIGISHCTECSLYFTSHFKWFSESFTLYLPHYNPLPVFPCPHPLVTPPKGIKNMKNKKVHFVLSICSVEHGQICSGLFLKRNWVMSLSWRREATHWFPAAWLAQSGKHETLNLRVIDSIPTLGTNLLEEAACCFLAAPK